MDFWRALPVFRWKRWFSVASPRTWIHMACTAQSAETEHGIMKEEDTGHATRTQSSTDSLTLRCQHLQGSLWGAKTMNLEVRRPGFTISFCSLSAVGPWANYLPPLSLRSFMCKMVIRKTHFLERVVKITGGRGWGGKCLVQCLTHSRHSTKGGECQLLEGKLHGAGSMAAGSSASRCCVGRHTLEPANIWWMNACSLPWERHTMSVSRTRDSDKSFVLH